MSDEGKYPFEGTPQLGKSFSDEKSHDESSDNKVEKTHDEKYETPAPAPKPSWMKNSYEYTKTEEQLPFILEKPRTIEAPTNHQNYDVIKDNNIDVGIELKSQWDAKVWEAPRPEIGDD